MIRGGATIIQFLPALDRANCEPSRSPSSSTSPVFKKKRQGKTFDVFECACGNHAFRPAPRGNVLMVSPSDRIVLERTIYVQNFRRGAAHVILSQNGQRRNAFLHREIMNPPPRMVVDHINHNRLDNRRENLRICTQSQNMANTRGKRRSLPKGVYYQDGKYLTKIRKDGKMHYIGCFATAEEASEAYNRVAKELFGEFALAVSTQETWSSRRVRKAVLL